MKPFNLKEALAGRPVCTSAGTPITIVMLIPGENPILLGLIRSTVYSFYESGKCLEDSRRNLYMVDATRNITRWINLVEKDPIPRTIGPYWDTEEQAKHAAKGCSNHLVTTLVRISTKIPCKACKCPDRYSCSSYDMTAEPTDVIHLIPKIDTEEAFDCFEPMVSLTSDRQLALDRALLNKPKDYDY